jgi:hypothetical protein
MTANEKALISAAVKWHDEWQGILRSECRCTKCNLIHAVRRVVKERKGK